MRLRQILVSMAMLSMSLPGCSAQATAPSIWAIVRTHDPIQEVDMLAHEKVVGGIIYYTSLRTLSPQDGLYDWSGLDAIVRVCEATQKPLKLAVLGGRWVPDWLYAKGAQKFTWTHNTPYVDAGSQTASACVPWDPVYLGALTDTLRACAERHGTNPLLVEIQVTGPALANGLEMNLSIKPDEAATIGYTRDLLVGAWCRMIDECATLFPRQSLSIALHNDLLGERTSALSSQVRDYALRKHPGKVNLLVCYATPEPWFDHGNSAVDVWADAPKPALKEAQLIDLFSAKHAPVSDVGTAIRRSVALGASRIEIFSADLISPAYRKGVEDTLIELSASR